MLREVELRKSPEKLKNGTYKGANIMLTGGQKGTEEQEREGVGEKDKAAPCGVQNVTVLGTQEMH